MARSRGQTVPGTVRAAVAMPWLRIATGAAGLSAVLGLGMLLVPVESGPRVLLANGGLLLAPLAAGLAALYAGGVGPSRGARRAWRLLALAALLATLGQATWTLQEVVLGGPVPFPSASFGLFVVFHVLFAAAAILALRPARDPQHGLEVALDGVLFLLAAAILWLRFVLEEPVVNDWLTTRQAAAMLVGEVATTASFFFAMLLLVWRDTDLPMVAVRGLALVAAVFLAGTILMVAGGDPRPARSGDGFELVWLAGWLVLFGAGVAAGLRPEASPRAVSRTRTARRIRHAIIPASALFLAVACIDAVGRPYFTPGSAALLLLMGVVLAVRVVNALTTTERHAERRRRAEGEALRARARAMVGRLHPHFILNVLNVVAELVRVGSTDAEEAVQRLARLLRYTLEAGHGEDLITFRTELRITEEYLYLERLRYGDRLRVSLSIDPAALDRLVPPFVLQPLVENAVRHGVGRRPGGGSVRVRGRIRKGMLGIEIADDGVGADPESMTTATGLGLTGVRAQLRAHYGREARMRVRTSPGDGCTVRLLIPRAEA